MSASLNMYLRRYVQRRFLNEGEASGGTDTGASSGGDAGESASSGGGTYDSIGDAVAELQRRETARTEARKAAAPAPAGSPTPAPEPGEEQDPADDPLDDDIDPDADPGDDDPVGPDDDPDAPNAQAPEKITFDGKELEIPKGTPKALVEAVQKMATELKTDYTHKTQEVAQARQQVAAAEQRVVERFQQQDQAQQALAWMFQQAVPPEPDIALLQTDPHTYLLQKAQRDQSLNTLDRVMQHNAQQREQMAAQQSQAQEQSVAKAAQVVLKNMPELADPAKYTAFRNSVLSTVSQYGFTEADVKAIADPRMVHMLRDLTRFHARDAAAGQARQKLNNAPPKVQKPGAAAVSQGENSKAREALGQFKKSARTLADVRKWAERTSR